jgi:hypothetical protein
VEGINSRRRGDVKGLGFHQIHGGGGGSHGGPLEVVDKPPDLLVVELAAAGNRLSPSSNHREPWMPPPLPSPTRISTEIVKKRKKVGGRGNDYGCTPLRGRFHSGGGYKRRSWKGTGWTTTGVGEAMAAALYGRMRWQR